MPGSELCPRAACKSLDSEAVDRTRVLVVGAGQAGLAMSAELGRRGVEHVVVERGRVGQAWRDRWDSFCLVTPNWTIRLPDGAYDGDDPDGYLLRDELVDFMERYAARIGAPVREGTAVTAVEPADDGGFTVRTSTGDIRADRVVLASGTYRQPHRPGIETLPADLPRIDAAEYRNPRQLPDGGVLIIGFGQTGGQFAEELAADGRDVVIACGRAPWIPRRLGTVDAVWWAVEAGFLDQPVGALRSPAERLTANLQNSGHGGGHDMHYRTLRAQGIELVGRFLGAEGRDARFADDLGASVAWGDARYAEFMDVVRRHAIEHRLEMPEIPVPEPFDATAPDRVSLDRFGSVIYAGGYRPGYRALLPWAAHAFDADGFPIHVDGESSAVPGLHFIGVHFLRKRKSSLLLGVGEDAAIVAERIAAG